MTRSPAPSVTSWPIASTRRRAASAAPGWMSIRAPAPAPPRLRVAARVGAPRGGALRSGRSSSASARSVLVGVAAIVADRRAGIGPDGEIGLPGAAHGEDGYEHADQRIRQRGAEGDEDRAGDNGEADDPVGAGVVAVGYQRRA